MQNSLSHIALTDTVAASAQIQASDMSAVAESGFAVVINNRPDGESIGQPSSDELRVAAEAAGLEYHYYPVDGFNYPGDRMVDMAAAFSNTDKPVFAFCRSGTRSANLWVNSLPAEAQDAARRHTQQLGFDVSMSMSLR